jgi:hypothetical protein
MTTPVSASLVLTPASRTALSIAPSLCAVLALDPLEPESCMTECCEPKCAWSVGACDPLRFPTGTSLLATLTITNPATGLPFDPASVFAESYSPGSVTTSLTTTKVSAGVYTAPLPLAAPGPWVLRMSDSATAPVGSTFVAELRINATPLKF